MLQSLWLQRVGHDLVTKQQQKDTQTEFSLHALQLKTNRQKKLCFFQPLHHVICILLLLTITKREPINRTVNVIFFFYAHLYIHTAHDSTTE